jgi:hypothetical protein
MTLREKFQNLREEQDTAKQLAQETEYQKVRDQISGLESLKSRYAGMIEELNAGSVDLAQARGKARKEVKELWSIVEGNSDLLTDSKILEKLGVPADISEKGIRSAGDMIGFVESGQSDKAMPDDTENKEVVEYTKSRQEARDKAGSLRKKKAEVIEATLPEDEAWKQRSTKKSVSNFVGQERINRLGVEGKYKLNKNQVIEAVQKKIGEIDKEIELLSRKTPEGKERFLSRKKQEITERFGENPGDHEVKVDDLRDVLEINDVGEDGEQFLRTVVVDRIHQTAQKKYENRRKKEKLDERTQDTAKIQNLQKEYREGEQNILATRKRAEEMISRLSEVLKINGDLLSKLKGYGRSDPEGAAEFYVKNAVRQLNPRSYMRDNPEDNWNMLFQENFLKNFSQGIQEFTKYAEQPPQHSSWTDSVIDPVILKRIAENIDKVLDEVEKQIESADIPYKSGLIDFDYARKLMIRDEDRYYKLNQSTSSDFRDGKSLNQINAAVGEKDAQLQQRMQLEKEDDEAGFNYNLIVAKQRELFEGDSELRLSRGINIGQLEQKDKALERDHQVAEEILSGLSALRDNEFIMDVPIFMKSHSDYNSERYWQERANLLQEKDKLEKEEIPRKQREIESKSREGDGLFGWKAKAKRSAIQSLEQEKSDKEEKLRVIKNRIGELNRLFDKIGEIMQVIRGKKDYSYNEKYRDFWNDRESPRIIQILGREMSAGELQKAVRGVALKAKEERLTPQEQAIINRRKQLQREQHDNWEVMQKASQKLDKLGRYYD